MDLVWSEEMASTSFLETVGLCPELTNIGIPELLSGMAAGWNSKLIVESWFFGDPIEESIGLTIAARNTGGRHVCILPNEATMDFYVTTYQEMGVPLPEVVVAVAADTVVPQFEGIDFLVVDCTKDNYFRVLRAARVRQQGAVLACKNVRIRNFGGEFKLSVQLEMGMHVDRSISQTVGAGFDVVYVRSMPHDAPAPPPPPPPPALPPPPTTTTTLPPPPPPPTPTLPPLPTLPSSPPTLPPPTLPPPPQQPPPQQPALSNRRPRRLWFTVQDPRIEEKHIFEV